MLLLIRTFAIIALCLVTNWSQSPEPSKLIEEINADKAKTRKILEEAERKRGEARTRGEAGDHSEHARLITEASRLYGEISKLLNKTADKADEVAKVRDPEWYSEYFTTYAKRFRNLATIAANAEEELLVRRDGGPSEAQLKSWKARIEKIGKESDELWTKIEEIEKRRGVVLIK